ncbi:hypothetical protein ACFV4K_28010 [Nocardia sp. NPDC059764]|uniref:hypothetical protein n=1 Tax=Nocardia sp. NPDC059764 TaxID=3346939 RepID=UPI00365A6B4E
MRTDTRHAQAVGRYLQFSDGSWAIVGADGWPVDLETYEANAVEFQSRELEDNQGEDCSLSCYEGNQP